MTGTSRTVVIVGGGIAGLSTAFALQEQAAAAGVPISCTVLEAAPAWGGKIVTHRVNDLVIEAGPDSFLSQKPAGLELCSKLGLSDQLINTNETSQKASVFFRGRLHELPEGLVTFTPTRLGPFLRSGVLSWAGLARMGLDVLMPARRSTEDESLASFFRRRFGRQAFERVIEPLMAGIYAGDAEQMSVLATFPRFVELEQRHGSLIRGMAASHRARAGSAASGPRRTMFVTLREGVADLVTALTAHLQRQGVILRTGCTVSALRVRSHHVGRWTYDVMMENGSALSTEALVLATPAYVSAELVRPLSPVAAGLMERIPYASTATISLAYDSHTVGRMVEGFGFVVPRVEGRDLIAATWTSIKWPHRAPPDQFLVRCYVGGVGREGILKLDDAELLQHVRADLAGMARLTVSPRYAEVHRWNRAMPQYTLGHLGRIAGIEAALGRFPGLFVTGAAYRGVGIPDCIKDGTTIAVAVLRHMMPTAS